MTQEIVDVRAKTIAALDKVREGVLFVEACREVGIVYDKAIKCVRSDALLNEYYTAVHEACAAELARSTMDIADTDMDSNRSRLRIQARQWLAARLDRKAWGDKVEVKLDANVSISDALAAADARLRPLSDQGKVIDAEFTDSTASNAGQATDSESVGTRLGLPNPFD